MKKYFAVFVLSVLLFSCEKEETGFKGFGNLVLGADFKSIKHADKFETMAPNEHFILKYELNEELGPVDRVYVTTSGGKIAEVKFNASEHTNMDAMTRSYSDLQKFEQASQTIANSRLDFFIAKDSSVMLGVIKDPPFSSNTKNSYEFVYMDKTEMEARARKLKSMK